jgi:hypothetical protein
MTHPKPGELCPSCKDEGRPETTLVSIGFLEKSKKSVAVCPYHDGERIIEIYKSQGV